MLSLTNLSHDLRSIIISNAHLNNFVSKSWISLKFFMNNKTQKNYKK
jgi:hypothetical protein